MIITNKIILFIRTQNWVCFLIEIKHDLSAESGQVKFRGQHTCPVVYARRIADPELIGGRNLMGCKPLYANPAKVLAKVLAKGKS